MAGNFHPLVGDQAINAKQRIDYISATRILYGFSAPGTLESAASWQIREETLDSEGRTIAINFAGRTLEYNQIWNNRLTLTYT